MDDVIELTTVSAPRRRILTVGALGGVLATALFVMVHQILISNIWMMFLPMAISGAVCGLAIAWSYTEMSDARTARGWFALNATYLGSLFGLGVVSLFVFAPTWTFAELNVADPPLGDLFSRATPLMAMFTIVAGLLIWWISGARRTSLIPFLVTEALLVFLLGHNLAIIGLVDLSADGRSQVGLMFGLVALLGISYAVIVEAAHQLLPQRRLVP